MSEPGGKVACVNIEADFLGDALILLYVGSSESAQLSLIQFAFIVVEAG